VKAKSKSSKYSESWYMDERGIKIPLSELKKNAPPRTGPSKSEVMKKNGLFPYIELVDMRAVMK
jgi:hypothetical protein